MAKMERKNPVIKDSADNWQKKKEKNENTQKSLHFPPPI